ncbi:hypothetical protein [Streptomyces sp. CB03911]|uniref:hypothetical protein n=1 Tax=Streptomyces sp. CB03911 TaxID=1804758 RepID=UPI00094062E0|nr:hypothetical protein [Streptomyces sp. CB03911]OKI16315.1 hypothetical protein A6A07_09695 [Streptomyces sp. CB03911]
MRLDLPAPVREVREVRCLGRTQVTAGSQGDLAESEHRRPPAPGWTSGTPGGKPLAGDAAILLKYLLGTGGWLVPA